MAEHNLQVKSFLLPLIWKGTKTLEIRPAWPFFSSIRSGDILVFNGQVRRVVRQVAVFTHLTQAVSEADAPRLWPEHNRKQVLDALRKIYPHHHGRFILFTLTSE